MTTGAELAGITTHEIARLQKLKDKNPRDMVPMDRMFIKDITQRLQRVMTSANATPEELAAVRRLLR